MIPTGRPFFAGPRRVLRRFDTIGVLFPLNYIPFDRRT
jgi:hypothetical protein